MAHFLKVRHPHSNKIRIFAVYLCQQTQLLRHIAVNTRLLLPNKIEGISRFAYEILSRMVKAHEDVHFSFIFDRKWDESYVFGENVSPYQLPFPLRHPILWYAGFEYAIPFLLKKLKPEVFFSPESYIPIHKTCPQVAVFHDIDYEIRPQDIGKKRDLWYLQHFFPKYARAADKIIAVSEYTKNELMQRYNIEQEKIRVAYNGCTHHFAPISEEIKAQTRQKYADSCPYFYFVGTIQPRKNIENLLLSFDLYKKMTDSPTKLLIVGKKGWKLESALQIYENMQFKADVRFTGFVSDEELNQISAASLGLCMVSFLEGFGIPAVEAMHCETAIIASHTAALPEVCGKAALYISPENPESIVKAMQQLAQDMPLRNRLIAAGRIERTRFSWDNSAEIVWGELEKFS